jgi:hypothetical protein
MNNVITKIQLVGDVVGYLEVDKDLPAPLNMSISDIRDISKRNGSFSKTITLPGTKNNNQLMNFYFDVNVNDGNPLQGQLNINRIQKCILLQDNIPLHENELYLQLIKVNKVQNNITEDDEVSYDVVLRDDVGEFFIRMSNKELTDLDFSEYDHILNPTTIINSFNNTYLNGYKYILPFKDDSRFWFPNEPIASTYVRIIWDKIHSSNGFSYQWYLNQEPDFFNQLIIPHTNKNRQNESLIRQNQVLVRRVPSFEHNMFSFGSNIMPLLAPDIYRFDEIVLDESNSYTLILPPAPYQSFLTPNLTATNAYKVKLTFDYAFKLQGSSTAIDITVPNQARTIRGIVRPFLRNNTTNENIFLPEREVILQTNDNCLGGTCTYPFIPGFPQFWENTQFFQVYEEEIIIPQTSLTDNWEMRLIYECRIFDNGSKTSLNVQASDPWRFILELQNSLMDISIDDSAVILNQQIEYNSFINEDIKQSDFMKSIYQMFNIYCVPDKNQPTRLVYYTRDDFYRSGNNLDWTLKLARDFEQNVEFLPELTSKELLLTYKEDDDEANQFYTSITKRTFGDLKKTFDNEYVKGVDKKELIFSPTPGGLSIRGHYLPYLEKDKNIRILIDNGTTFVGSFFMGIITGYATNGGIIDTPFTQYPYVSHLNKRVDANFDLNFGNSEYYFYNIGNETLNNLGNLYWLNTLNQIDKGKLLTAYFYLTPYDINKLNLNDTIRIDNSYWNINKIIDYNFADKTLTKVELISSSDLLPAPFVPRTDDEEPEEFVFEPETIEYMGLLDINNDNTIYNSGTPQARRGYQIWRAINTYIKTLKDNNIAGANWSNVGTATCIVYRDYPFIGGTQIQHSYNLAILGNTMTFVGPWIHDELGITSNGINTYAFDGININNISNTAFTHTYALKQVGTPVGVKYAGGIRIGSDELSLFYDGSNANMAALVTPSTINSLLPGVTVLNADFSQLRNLDPDFNIVTLILGGPIDTSVTKFVGNTPPTSSGIIPLGALNDNGSINTSIGLQANYRHHCLSTEASLFTPTQFSNWQTARKTLAIALNRQI